MAQLPTTSQTPPTSSAASAVTNAVAALNLASAPPAAPVLSDTLAGPATAAVSLMPEGDSFYDKPLALQFLQLTAGLLFLPSSNPTSTSALNLDWGPGITAPPVIPGQPAPRNDVLAGGLVVQDILKGYGARARHDSTEAKWVDVAYAVFRRSDGMTLGFEGILTPVTFRLDRAAPPQPINKAIQIAARNMRLYGVRRIIVPNTWTQHDGPDFPNPEVVVLLVLTRLH
ncbi:hypothetical protein HDU88_000425 [Geranomyces variabilis]|nr:hypothetical protein HDU88_000425 [Geranomyces variabilis]